MSVYAEWFWSCDECEDRAEEPWGDAVAAREELEEHMRSEHPEPADPS